MAGFTTRQGLSDDTISQILEDDDGNLWLGTEKGLSRFYDGRIDTAAGIKELAGDLLEVTATMTRAGRRSRDLAFEARVTCRADPGRGPSAAVALAEPVIAVTAAGTVVVP